MLVLTRKLNQAIMIQDNIKIKVLEVNDHCVKIGIEAPRNIAVHREEIFEEIQIENQRAAVAPADFDLSTFLKEAS